MTRLRAVTGLVVVSLVLAACGGGTAMGGAQAATPAADDQLASILARGTLAVSSDLPQPDHRL